ncbi:MAG TPA: ribose-phosphate pyrophosphokinase [Ktedonobacterales bacterium]|nr:ribose-phosphate pyrophosphokinase [Ktedonobacterales bacterium]
MPANAGDLPAGDSATLNVAISEVVELTDLNTPPCVIAGSANPALATAIAARLGIPLLERRIERFPDGETYVRVGSSVRGRDAYIIQPTCAPVNDNLFELLLLIDTLRRASAGRLTAIVPYYGYARQDRKVTGREPISGKLVANLLTAAGANRIVAIDLHSPAIQGFFDIGMDHLTAIPLLADYLADRCPTESIIVSPDTGGVKRADLYARLLNLPIAILYKRRESARKVEIAAIIGDVRDKCPIIVDDIIATGGTIRQAVDTLIANGARPEVRIVATHGVFAGDAPHLLRHPAIAEIVVSDTIPTSDSLRAALPSLHVVSIADLLANAIRRLHSGLSLSELFAREGTPPV